jgi:hypothetical protein
MSGRSVNGMEVTRRESGPGAMRRGKPLDRQTRAIPVVRQLMRRRARGLRGRRHAKELRASNCQLLNPNSYRVRRNPGRKSPRPALETAETSEARPRLRSRHGRSGDRRWSGDARETGTCRRRRALRNARTGLPPQGEGSRKTTWSIGRRCKSGNTLSRPVLTADRFAALIPYPPLWGTC